MPKTLSTAERERAEALLSAFENLGDFSMVIHNPNTGLNEKFDLPPVNSLINPALRLVMAYFQDERDAAIARLDALERRLDAMETRQ